MKSRLPESAKLYVGHTKEFTPRAFLLEYLQLFVNEPAITSELNRLGFFKGTVFENVKDAGEIDLSQFYIKYGELLIRVYLNDLSSSDIDKLAGRGILLRMVDKDKIVEAINPIAAERIKSRRESAKKKSDNIRAAIAERKNNGEHNLIDDETRDKINQLPPEPPPIVTEVNGQLIENPTSESIQ